MSGIGALLFGLIFGGSAIGAGIDNAKSLSKPFTHLKDGTPVYVDRKGQRYINGEKVIQKYDARTDSMRDVGEKSGKIYFDERDTQRERIAKRNERDRREAKRRGLTTYIKTFVGNNGWEHNMKADVTNDLAIKDVISSEDGTFWVWYFRKGGELGGVPGDLVQVTFDEYMKMSVAMGYNRYYSLKMPKEDLPIVPGKQVPTERDLELDKYVAKYICVEDVDAIWVVHEGKVYSPFETKRPVLKGTELFRNGRGVLYEKNGMPISHPEFYGAGKFKLVEEYDTPRELKDCT